MNLRTNPQSDTCANCSSFLIARKGASHGGATHVDVTSSTIYERGGQQ